MLHGMTWTCWLWSRPFGTLSTNSYGDFVYAVSGSGQLNTFYPTHAAYTITCGAVVFYSVVNKYAPGPTPCFKDDSTILSFKEGHELYVKVQDN